MLGRRSALALERLATRLAEVALQTNRAGRLAECRSAVLKTQSAVGGNKVTCRTGSFFLAWAGLSDSGCCARSLQEAKNNKKKHNKYKLRQANRSQKR